jgi:murein L,D-transpeptidase YafK
MQSTRYAPRLVTIIVLFAVGAAATAEENHPASLIRIPESASTVFIAETSTARFHRFDRQGENLSHTGSYYMSIGRDGPGKQNAGDKRTPLGAYFVTEQLDTSKLHEKYGVTAFPLDYPNAWDQRRERGGNGIWVHGVDPRSGQRPELDTDGCIALTNEDLMSLAPLFQSNVTPVLVMHAIRWVDASDVLALRAELEQRVAEWVSSNAAGDLYAYLSLYDGSFERWGLNFDEWSSLTLQTQALDPLRNATLRELLLLAYPEENELYLSRFQLVVEAGDRKIMTTKRLYWRRDASGALKIIAENEG